MKKTPHDMFLFWANKDAQAIAGLWHTDPQTYASSEHWQAAIRSSTHNIIETIAISNILMSIHAHPEIAITHRTILESLFSPVEWEHIYLDTNEGAYAMSMFINDRIQRVLTEEQWEQVKQEMLDAMVQRIHTLLPDDMQHAIGVQI